MTLRYSTKEEIAEYIAFRKQLDADGKEKGDGHTTCKICGDTFYSPGKASLVFPTTPGERCHKYCYCMSSYYHE